MTVNKEQIQQAVFSGVKRGWSGFIWLLKILLPISLFTTLLVYSGWIGKIDFLLEPAMAFLNLPPMAALPLIAGLFTGIYGGIAAMTALPLSMDHMTLIAIFLLISHNIIQEGIVQAKTGLNLLTATIVRLTASVITVFAASLYLAPETAAAPAAAHAVSGEALSLSAVLTGWAVNNFFLSLKILGVIMSLMVALELMKLFDLINRIVSLITPLLRLMGLSKSVGVLWLTAAIFGLAYGSAVLIEEAKESHIDPEEMKKLQFSMGINHAMVEDPALFIPLGIGVFWLWVPRLIAAMIAAQLLGLYYKARGRRVLSPAVDRTP